MRPIDADRLIERFREGSDRSEAAKRIIRAIVKVIDSEPTVEKGPFIRYSFDAAKGKHKVELVDAVEVIRCKDCKYAGINKHDRPLCHLVNRTVKLDGFCSVGERKEG